MVAKQILVVVHQKTSTPGLVGDVLQEYGYELDIRCPALGAELPETMADHAGALVFGGPMSANDDHEPFIRAELDWIPTVLAARKPYLGICLGGQLLARVLGATVQPHPEQRREIGYFPIQPAIAPAATSAATSAPSAVKSATPSEFRQPMHVYQWHSEGFEVPSEAVLLAQGATSFPNQAFRYGHHAYGLQFHPEITADMIEFWTTKAPEQLELPGAQSRQQHIESHQRYSAAVEQWLRGFLGHWLREHRSDHAVSFPRLRQSA
jgi:GMP synthase (glutamine-hydrolysing)